jgi:aspartate/tyrosine/aromatic aminotransferase
MAYQGFATGDLSRDNWAVRLFADNGVPFMCGTSFAKNMGLYGTRTGTLSVVCDSKGEATNVESQLNKVARNTWSSPPLHGGKIAEIVLSNPEIRTAWDQDLLTMSGRIREMRELFVQKLADAGSPHDWSHILRQIGMFAFTGVGKAQCQEMMDKHAVYLTLNGRISIAGLNTNNMDYTVECFHDITKNGRS